jgi:hypothetical protein
MNIISWLTTLFLMNWLYSEEWKNSFEQWIGMHVEESGYGLF